jgi:hypothetical protein
MAGAAGDKGPGATLASAFARLTLGHLQRPWPYHHMQVLTRAADQTLPAQAHPIFHGSFDWHSCVHGWWQVMRLLRLYPDLPEGGEIIAKADRLLTPAYVAGELATFDKPASAGFERPYGWAWLLALHGELALWPDRPWAAALAPLAHHLAAGFRAFLPRLLYPVRSGKHDSTAFALILARRWALVHDGVLADLIGRRARDWFLGDRDARPWEPGGEDFLSPILCEAMLMREVLDARAFAVWFAGFLPDPFGPHAACLRQPALVSDRSDGRLAHLDGLNLSRAWCWRALAGHCGDPSAAWAIAQDHLDAAMPHIADHYMGEHWLATFALLAFE